MRIEFDRAKNETNQAKHGISLQAATGFVWHTALERVDDRFDYGEVRFVAIGLIGAQLHVMIFTEVSDDEVIRIISLRPAEKHERRFYHGEV